MRLQAVEEAFLEDLYDERRKLRVELPTEGFVYYAAPTSSPKSVWQVSLAADEVADAYIGNSGRLSLEALHKLMSKVKIKNVSSARVRQVVAQHRSLKMVGGQDDAKAQMIKHVAQWIGDNFGHESRETSVQLAAEALDILRSGGDTKIAVDMARLARRWFPTFWLAVQKEVGRGVEAEAS